MSTDGTARVESEDDSNKAGERVFRNAPLQMLVRGLSPNNVRLPDHAGTLNDRGLEIVATA